MTTCAYDTGSMYGCTPACSSPATVEFTYSSFCYSPFVMPLCAAHVGSMAGRVYAYSTRPLGAGLSYNDTTRTETGVSS